METTIVYWGYIGIMEKKMETTIMGTCRVYNPIISRVTVVMGLVFRL